MPDILAIVKGVIKQRRKQGVSYPPNAVQFVYNKIATDLPVNAGINETIAVMDAAFREAERVGRAIVENEWQMN